MHEDRAPSSRDLADLVGRYVAQLSQAYRSRAWMNARSHLARLVVAVDSLEYEPLRDAARDLAANTELSKAYRADVIATWRRFLAWCSEELIVDASTVDRFAHVRLRFPRLSLDQLTQPTEISEPRPGKRGRRPKVATRTAPDPRHDPDAFLAQVTRAMPTLSTELREIVQLLMLTGCRPGELLGLTTTAINTDHAPWVAVVNLHKTSDSTGKPKLIVLSTRASKLIDRRLRPFCPDDWLFPAPKAPDRCISRDLVQKRLRRSLLRAQLPTWTLYDARRWAGTVARASEGLEAAQRLLGHSRASTTEIYAPPQLGDAIRAAEVLDRRAAS